MTVLTVSRFGRGACPECDRVVALTRGGRRIRRHGAKNGAWPPVDRPGTGREPKEEAK